MLDFDVKCFFTRFCKKKIDGKIFGLNYPFYLLQKFVPVYYCVRISAKNDIDKFIKFVSKNAKHLI
jgi:hypothetical protein